MKTCISWLGALVMLLGWLAPSAHAQTCAAPTNVSLSTITTTTAVVSFTPSASALAYVVRYYWTGDSTAAGIKRRITPTSPLTLTGLRVAATYRLLVGSICGPGDTLYSSSRLFTTAGGGGSATCGPVTNVHVSGISSIGATVSFTPVSGALSYTISYYAVGDTANVQTITTLNPSATLAGLLPATAYVVRVKATCSSGASAVVISTFQTSANPTTCGAVTNVVVTATSSSTATVSFTPGAGNASFHITYHIANDSTHWVNATTSPAVLTGLVPGQTYYIQVISLCGTGATTVYTGGSSITYNFRGMGALSSRNALGAGTMELYPNPAHQAVGLLLPAVPGTTTAQISLLNALGQPVLAKQLALTGAATQTQLDLAGVAPGLYTVRVAVGGQYASQRLAVE